MTFLTVCWQMSEVKTAQKQNNTEKCMHEFHPHVCACVRKVPEKKARRWREKQNIENKKVVGGGKKFPKSKQRNLKNKSHFFASRKKISWPFLFRQTGYDAIFFTRPALRCFKRQVDWRQTHTRAFHTKRREPQGPSVHCHACGFVAKQNKPLASVVLSKRSPQGGKRKPAFGAVVAWLNLFRSWRRVCMCVMWVPRVLLTVSLVHRFRPLSVCDFRSPVWPSEDDLRTKIVVQWFRWLFSPFYSPIVCVCVTQDVLRTSQDS